MTITIHFKTPDAVDYALEDMEDDESEILIREKLRKWIRYGECVSIQFDLETMTATVLETEK